MIVVPVPAYTRRPRQLPPSLVLVHATRGPAPSRMQDQFPATVDFFRSAPQYLPGPYTWGPTADYLVGSEPGQVAQFGDPRTQRSCWSAGYGDRPDLEWGVDEVAIGVEFAQPAPGTEPFTAACIANAVELLAPIVAEYDIPLVRVPYWDQQGDAPRGFIGHEDTATGRKWGKSDPGPLFPWQQLFDAIAVRNGAPQQPVVPQQGGGPVPAPPLGPYTETHYVGWDAAAGEHVYEFVMETPNPQQAPYTEFVFKGTNADGRFLWQIRVQPNWPA